MIVSVSYELLISNLKLKDFNAYHSNIHCIISLCVDNKADAMKPNPNLRKKERRVTNYNIIVDRWAGANNPHAHTYTLEKLTLLLFAPKQKMTQNKK